MFLSFSPSLTPPPHSSGAGLKPSHQVQVCFYALALQAALLQVKGAEDIRVDALGAVWLPGEETGRAASAPSCSSSPFANLSWLYRQELFPLSLAGPLLTTLLASHLPTHIMRDPRPKWHLSSTCQGD